MILCNLSLLCLGLISCGLVLLVVSLYLRGFFKWVQFPGEERMSSLQLAEINPQRTLSFHLKINDKGTLLSHLL